MPLRQPTAPLPRAEPYVRAGEQVITLTPGLVIDKERYDIHYLAGASGPAAADASLFQSHTSDTFSHRGVHAFIVTQDRNKIVTDPALLEEIFLLYNAAYFLYTAPPDALASDFGADLALILKNPLFMAMTPAQALAGRRQQTAAALRALLISQTAATEADAAIEEALIADPATVGEALHALNQVLARKLAGVAAIAGDLDQLPAPLQAVDRTLTWADNFRLLLRFYYILTATTTYQQERAAWLDAYAAAFVNRDGSLDSTELRALADVFAEVGDVNRQRLDAALEAALDESVDAFFGATALFTAAKARAVAAAVAEQSGSKLLSGAVGAALSNVAIGLTVNNLLYGVDDLYASFTIADRAVALRDVFRDGRVAMQSVAANAGAAAPYDGAIVAPFRLAWLLEQLAHVTAQRAYADGIAAVASRPNPTEVLNLVAGRDWEDDAARLRQAADAQEQAILARLGAPLWLDDALILAADRTSDLPSAPAASPSLPAATQPTVIDDATMLLEQFLADSATAGTLRIVSDARTSAPGSEQRMSMDCAIALPAQAYCTGSVRVTALLGTQAVNFDLLIEEDGIYARQRGDAWEDITGDEVLGDTLQDLVGQSAIAAFSTNMALDAAMAELDGEPLYVLRYTIDPYSYARLLADDAAAAVRRAADRGRFQGEGVAYFTTGPVLLRRQVIELNFPVQGLNTTTTTTSEYDYDVEVTIPSRR